MKANLLKNVITKGIRKFRGGFCGWIYPLFENDITTTELTFTMTDTLQKHAIQL